MIYYHSYILQGVTGYTRQGALLKVEESGAWGVADCHPWEELGDLPLAKQLDCLRQGTLTPLLKQALMHAKRDKEARIAKKSLLEGVKVPNSHWLAMDHELSLPLQEEFTHVKIKLKGEWHSFLKLLDRYPFKWRLDFNGSLSKEDLPKLLDDLLPYLASIDFIEDPLPYWIPFSGLPIAEDRVEWKDTEIAIWKPSLSSCPHKKRVIVTSYLGHPVGQVADASLASPFQEVAGLLSHRTYKMNPFSERLSWKGPSFRSPGGTGVGFDDLLERLIWHPL